MFAALANFNLNFVTQGTVERLPDVDGKPRYKVTLDQVGIYVKDSYDFNDDAVWYKPWSWPSQPLGFWSCVDQDASKDGGKMFDSNYKYVTNEDFREWRDQYGNGKGGDFLVFSDIKVLTLYDTFEFSK